MISPDKITHWANHAISDSWEHLAIQELIAERAAYLPQPPPKHVEPTTVKVESTKHTPRSRG